MGRVAFTESGLDAAAPRLSTLGARTRGRVLLSAGPAGRPEPGARGAGTGSTPGLAARRSGRTFAGATRRAGATRASASRTAYLVCAHGRHDTCCAVRGRPLRGRLAGARPEPEWECSHVGGCRFAPAVVLLPHGYVLGAVPPTRGGRRARLRGRADRPALGARPVASTARGAGRAAPRPAALGALGVDALRPVSVTTTAEGERVGLAEPDVTVVLRERHAPAGRPLTCASHVPGRLRTFELVSLHAPSLT